MQKAAQEELKRLQAIERKEHERRVREERHVVWRHKTAVRLLCTSVDSLFLFFAQRVANLAGSRRAHNDALRANGERISGFDSPVVDLLSCVLFLCQDESFG